MMSLLGFVSLYDTKHRHGSDDDGAVEAEHNRNTNWQGVGCYLDPDVVDVGAGNCASTVYHHSEANELP